MGFKSIKTTGSGLEAFLLLLCQALFCLAEKRGETLTFDEMEELVLLTLDTLRADVKKAEANHES